MNLIIGIPASPSTPIPTPFCPFAIKSYLTGVTSHVSIVFIYRAALATTEWGGGRLCQVRLGYNTSPQSSLSLVMIDYYLCVFSLLFAVIVNCLYCLLVM